MVIGSIRGGYANQLYKYACAYATAKKYHQELIMITQTGNGSTDPFQLGEFPLEYSEVYVVESYIEAIQLLAEWSKKYKLVEVTEKEYFSKMSSALFEQYDGVILYGTFQKPFFFENYLSDLQSIFRFKRETLFLKMFQEEIAGKQSVAVHVRRGDFLTYDIFSGEKEYYKAAMCLLEDILGYGQAEYYIFSDDKEFVCSYFGRNKRIHYVSVYGDYREAIEEFLAISMCSHRILTEGSSFSRMADALNASRTGYSIYEKQGFEHMVFARENIIFMEPEMITGLSGYYAPLFERDFAPKNAISEIEIQGMNLPALTRQCIDTRDIAKEEEIALRIRKIELLNEGGDYLESLGQVRKLWETAYGTRYELQMHELYWTSLYRYGYRLESIVEAVFLENVRNDAKRWYNTEEQGILKRLCNAPKNMEIVLIPSRRFEPHVFEDMLHAGSILKRLGYDVTFMVWELTSDMGFYIQYNKTLYEISIYEDSRGHSLCCPVINLTKMECEYGNIKEFFESYFEPSKQVVLFAKQNKVFTAIEECMVAEKVTTVFWDYSHVTDAGNYKEVGEVTIRKPEIGEEEMMECYHHADYSITFSETIQIGKSILRLKDYSQKIYKPSKERNIADYYRIAPAAIENTFSIINNIISKAICDSD